MIRTRWLTSELIGTNNQPPVWAKTTISGIFLYVDDLGTVFPEVIAVEGDGYSRWYYNQEGGGAFWGWRAESDHFACHVVVIQDVDPASGQASFHAEWTNLDPLMVVEQAGNSSTRNGLWSRFAPCSANFPTLVFPQINVPFIGIGEVAPATYSEVYAIGEDTNDLAPAKWTSDYDWP